MWGSLRLAPIIVKVDHVQITALSRHTPNTNILRENRKSIKWTWAELYQMTVMSSIVITIEDIEQSFDVQYSHGG